MDAGDPAYWAEAVRNWHHRRDPQWNFGRDVPNSPGSAQTYARHMHYVPDDTDADALAKWDKEREPYRRTSDRLVIYSMDKTDPLKYGFLMLAFLQPDGHAQLQKGPSAAERREIWENIAYTHQVSGNMPDGTFSI